jgi:beta propeller repeat protein
MLTNHKVGTGFIVVLLTLVIASAAFGGIEIFPIARAPKDQQFPAVDDCTVAWQDNRNGDWDIGVADISNLGGIDPLTFADNFSEAQYPAVSGDVVVWQSKFFMDEDWDIAGVDLSTETFFSVVATYADEGRPAISGDLVVAQTRVTEHTNWNIIGIDISRRSDPRAFWIDDSSEDQWRPDVHGRIVIYQDIFGGTAYVSGMDLSDFDEAIWFPVPGVTGPQQYPAISGNWVVWQDEYEGASVIGGDNIFHPGLAQVFIPDHPSDSLYPDVYNNVVVWQDQRNGNWDIYGRNLTTRETFPIILQGADQTHPAISFSPRLQGYVVVWQDNRNGNWDIYGAVIDGPEVAGCISPLAGDVNADSVVDANDVDEVEADLGQQNGIPLDKD